MIKTKFYLIKHLLQANKGNSLTEEPLKTRAMHDEGEAIESPETVNKNSRNEQSRLGVTQQQKHIEY
jgi:hypothetical protein